MGNERFRYSSKLDYMNKNFGYSELSEIRLGGLSIDLKGWDQLWYYGERNHGSRN